MKKHVAKAALAAVIVFSSLQASAQDSAHQFSSVNASEAGITSMISDFFFNIKLDFNTYFRAARYVDGSCVEGLQEHWQVDGSGNYIPGTLFQTKC